MKMVVIQSHARVVQHHGLGQGYGRCDRGVSVPGHPALTLLRPLKLPSTKEMSAMHMPRFTAEASVYRTSKTYQAANGTLAGNASAMVIPQQCRLICRLVCPPPPSCCPPGQMCCGSCASGRCDDVCISPGQSCP